MATVGWARIAAVTTPFLAMTLAPGLVEHASARPLTGLYVAADGGASFAGSPTSADGQTRMETQTGPLGLGAIGWGFGNGLRAEIEGSVRSNDIDAIDTLRVDRRRLPLGNPTGRLQTEAGMVNLAYDLPFRGIVKPYVVAGIGYANLDFQNASGDEFARLRFPRRNVYIVPVVGYFGPAGAFAYQAGIGLSAAVPGIRSLEATVEYRYLGTANAAVPLTIIATDRINGRIPSAQVHQSFTLGDHALMVGLRYRFGLL